MAAVESVQAPTSSGESWALDLARFKSRQKHVAELHILGTATQAA